MTDNCQGRSMMITMHSRSVVWPLLFAAFGGACSGVEATPEQRAALERRLLLPFLRDVEVGCGELQIDVTGNFYGHVGQPAIDRQVHATRRERGAGFVDTVWTNPSGDPASAFVVTIGEPVDVAESAPPTARTRFRVVNQVRLRVFEDARALLLDVRAGGAFVFVREAGGKPREVAGYVVTAGVQRAP